MKITKFHKFIILAIILAAFLAYLVMTNFRLVKLLVGYNVPPQKTSQKSGGVSFLKIADGFNISVFAKDLSDPRVIAFDKKGRMFVSEPKEGKVVRIDDENKDGTADHKTVILEGLRLPHGLAFYTNPKTGTDYLYVAETHQVARYIYDIKNGNISDSNRKSPENIATLPPDGEHFTRTIVFGPNYRAKPIVQGNLEKESMSADKLYISVGSSCNVCVEDTWKRAAILESDPDGNYTAEFAGGLRNSVFFTFHPVTGEMWATEMGRDYLGDNLPPDEINIIHPGDKNDKYGAKRYGWPFCYGNRIKDTTFKPEKINRIDIPQDCSQTEPPVIEIPAHSAPLGLAFITSDRWPKEWRNYLLVAYHGSWNRSVPTGYKVVLYKLGKNGGVVKSADGRPEAEDFITGWFDGKNTLGRPVDLKFGPDGALYISDDSAGVIYRVTSG